MNLILLYGPPAAFEIFPDVPHLTLDNTKLSPLEAAKAILEHYPELG